MSGTKIRKITGPWSLKGAYFPKDRGKVFSCFSCCGGSTMGYKLAGFDVIGCNEIDPKVIEVYKINHKPKYSFNCSIREMLKIDLPDELYNLDILDGSPPCTSFSTAGVRERDWGKMKKFSEGQALQRLDDLFFEFIALAKKLQPRFIVAENVTGIVKGKAKGYIKEIIKAYFDAGYITQIFRLNAANMGVPQARERIFFISKRRDVQRKKIALSFSEKAISFGEASSWVDKPFNKEDLKLSPCLLRFYDKTRKGSSVGAVHPRESYFSKKRLSEKKPCLTITAAPKDLMHPTEKRHLSLNEYLVLSSFPMDMNWKDWHNNKAKWAMGMSVPPFMMQRIAIEIYEQWIK